ncbi:MAG TPA: nucleotidyltransferase domain-containing protein, partial [Bacteroidales bacterium]|nr:nucleotidyltransferase domain-containing protein [Bacteroidales bacterium]
FVFNRRVKRTLAMLGKAPLQEDDNQVLPIVSDKHWKWRYSMAQHIADAMDFDALGVKAVYIIGSVKEANAGPASDLDLLVHFAGDPHQESNLRYWIDGWSRSIAQTNYEMTGYQMEQGMVDLHLVTDQDLKNKTDSFAAMVGSHQNSARLLREK